jgi:hypothetical protein
MPTYKKGDVLLVHFPFSEDPNVTKPRPAVLLDDVYDEDHIVIKCTKTDWTDRKRCICIDQNTQEYKMMGLKEKTYIVVNDEVCLTKYDVIRFLGICPQHIMDQIEELRK